MSIRRHWASVATNGSGVGSATTTVNFSQTATATLTLSAGASYQTPLAIGSYSPLAGH